MCTCILLFVYLEVEHKFFSNLSSFCTRLLQILPPLLDWLVVKLPVSSSNTYMNVILFQDHRWTSESDRQSTLSLFLRPNKRQAYAHKLPGYDSDGHSKYFNGSSNLTHGQRRLTLNSLESTSVGDRKLPTEAYLQFKLADHESSTPLFHCCLKPKLINV
jgi:hypothetical protein